MACPQVPVVLNRGFAAHLHIEVVRGDPPCSAVEVSGELDVATAGRLAEALALELASDYRFTVLDVSRLTFCDATGLGVVLRAHHEYAAADGSLTLSGAGPHLARLLRITGLDAVLNLAATRPTTTASALPERI